MKESNLKRKNLTGEVGIFIIYDYIPKKPKRIYGKTTVNKSIALIDKSGIRHKEKKALNYKSKK